ncbi:hypothetical protein N7495_008044 [Penicillium taxi]|uniref:uncharacterized protein n=1 Tax=Penicillium taxi TaxID=168475 RepID=UPI00254592BD|nr:uncharacterized protein N7495_008044 [Penicillium taxi]KAJ5888003.1 hypothetical protein N7495_008044 [Penicillium taxi]
MLVHKSEEETWYAKWTQEPMEQYMILQGHRYLVTEVTIYNELTAKGPDEYGIGNITELNPLDVLVVRRGNRCVRIRLCTA